MKYLIALLAIFLLGCSAEAASERNEALILSSMNDEVWNYNPEMLLAKCYDLSEKGRKVCFDHYKQQMINLGKQIPQDVCDRTTVCL